VQEKTFGGVLHRRIDIVELQPGDYIEFYMDGMRVRRVRELVIGRKRRFVKFEPLSVPVFKTQTCQLDNIVYAWRAVV
jgi:hypothetical protein